MTTIVGLPGKSAGRLKLRPLRSSATRVGKILSACAVADSAIIINIVKTRTITSPLSTIRLVCVRLLQQIGSLATCHSSWHINLRSLKGAIMFITTMLCKPGQLALSPALVQSLLGAWGGRNLTWLAAMEAVEFATPIIPQNFWQVWEELQRLAIDLIVQPQEGRRKKNATSRYGQHHDRARMYR
jgi:hypothetical protein